MMTGTPRSSDILLLQRISLPALEPRLSRWRNLRWGDGQPAGLSVVKGRQALLSEHRTLKPCPLPS